MKQPKNVIIIGARGHGKVIADIIIKSGDSLMGFLDDDPSIGNEIIGYPILGKVEDLYKYSETAGFVIGIGNNYTRKRVADKYKVDWHTAIHPSAIIAIDVSIGEGTVVMANAVINTSTIIGRHCIINSGAVIEHDNDIADFVHVSPNASIGGTVSVGACTHVGIGASLKNNLSITSDCIIGAGSVVVKDIVEKGTYIGVPAKRMT